MISHTAILSRLQTEYRAYLAQQGQQDVDEDDFVADLYRRLVADGEDANPSSFPHLDNLSAAFLYDFLPIPTADRQPEFVYVPSTYRKRASKAAMKESVFVTEWNSTWEVGHLRHELFRREIPRRLRGLRQYRDQNIFLVPRSWHRYYAYSVLFHMVPRSVLERHDLPLFRRGLWPHWREDHWQEFIIPPDFDDRLSKAFADVVWRHLIPNSGHASFAKDESIRVLAHNLDFWLPHAHRVAENRLRELPRVAPSSADLERIARIETPPEVAIMMPRKGGTIWQGEEDARDAVHELVELADHDGQLRALVDAMHSHRVEEDFSERWSFAREDFERRLYRKRSKLKIKFVELTDTVPVHGPESEVFENLLWEDFLGLLNQKEREIVVFLRSGVTHLGEIAEQMGYANHSPISKALNRIRLQAEKFLE